jgi:hypothetical protein
LWIGGLNVRCQELEKRRHTEWQLDEILVNISGIWKSLNLAQQQEKNNLENQKKLRVPHFSDRIFKSKSR